MEIIHGASGSGKTTKLIQMIKEFGGVLVVPSVDIKRRLVDSNVLAEDQVISIQEHRKLLGSGKHYWIDNMEFLIERWFGPGCKGFSIDTFDSVECRFGNEQS